MVYYPDDNLPEFLRDLVPSDEDGDGELWREVKAQIEERVGISGSLVQALGARDFEDACKRINRLFLPLIERFPGMEMFENLRLFLIHQAAGEIAFGFTRRFTRNHGLRFCTVRRRSRKRPRGGWANRFHRR